ncbi:MAG: uroporphyrinogen-III synthase [Candidatus Omnitrophica bacterium]|nr:uroporphyrinogen-III synthase [Candidatus Omnitrophota bacterium]
MKDKRKIIRVGIRPTNLAMKQLDEISSLLEKKGYEIDLTSKIFDTKGDRDKETSLIQNTVEDFFTDSLDKALLDGEIDIAIHKATHLPRKLINGLNVFAITSSIDDVDVFVGNTSFNQLSDRAKVGTNSLLRQKFVKALKPKVEAVDIRGNLENKIGLIKKGDYAGAIFSKVELERVGQQNLIKDVMPWETEPLQGQIAVVGRSCDFELKSIFSKIDATKKNGNILYTGTSPKKYKLLGNIIHFPMVEILRIDFGEKEARQIINDLDRYHTILFASRFGVKYFFELLEQNGYLISDMSIKDFIAIGQDTAYALKWYNMEPVLTAEIAIGQSLFDDIARKYDLNNKKILFPRASNISAWMKRELDRLEVNVEEIIVYSNKKPNKKLLSFEDVDKILFTSPSTVNNYLEDYLIIPDSWEILCKGPLTSMVLKEAGYHSVVLL